MDYLQAIISEVTIMAPSMGAIFSAILAAILLIFSGFASGSEIAFFSLSPNDMNELEESTEGSRQSAAGNRQQIGNRQ